jgi:hypothetical protein
MAVFATWHGGSGYSIGTIDDDLESFPSIALARETFRERANTSGAAYLNTYYVNRENESVRFPAVDETTTMDVFLYDPRTGGDSPDFRLVLGPRGGVKRENY